MPAKPPDDNEPDRSGVSDAAHGIVVEFCHEIWERSPGASLTFGRGAEIDIDSDPRLHRQLGVFEHRDGWWWLSNLGRSIPLQVLHLDTGAAALLPPGTRAALCSAEVIVAFALRSARYELRVTQPGLVLPDAPTSGPVAPTITHEHYDLPLNLEQRQLLAALCETRLVDPAAALVLPSNQDIAERLGWTITKLNRKLDYLCERLTREGVPGLKRSGSRAVDRRSRLAEMALQSQMVGADDLALLP